MQILGLMNRYFRGAPPRLHPTGLDRSRQEFLGLPIVGAHLAAGLRVSVYCVERGKLLYFYVVYGVLSLGLDGECVSHTHVLFRVFGIWGLPVLVGGVRFEGGSIGPTTEVQQPVQSVPLLCCWRNKRIRRAERLAFSSC